MTSSKIFHFDLETTGLDPKTCAVWQLGALFEIDGRVEEELELRLRPPITAEIQPDALNLKGITRDFLAELPPASEGYRQLVSRFEFYCSRYDKTDKFVPCGYNVNFDLDFLMALFKRDNDDDYLFSWLFSCPIDVRTFVGVLVAKHGFRFKNHKLETLCKHFSIPLDAHDALSDIKATRELYRALKETI